MTKITIMGAGSTYFAKNILGDCLLTDVLKDAQYALYDTDPDRLDEAYKMMTNLNKNINGNRAQITPFLAIRNRRAALRGSDYIINTIQVGGYDPSTKVDFEISRKYKLNQCMGDNFGIGAIFRALRSIKVLEGFANDIRAVCPNAWVLNYSNPLSILTGHLLHHGGVKCIGLGSSEAKAVNHLLEGLDMADKYSPANFSVAGIHEMAWLLKIHKAGKDLYPEIKKAAEKKNRNARKKDGVKHDDMVALELLKQFGYYSTGSSLQLVDAVPSFASNFAPELAADFNVKVDEYLTLCQSQIQAWRKQRDAVAKNTKLSHARSSEYAADVLRAFITNEPCEINANIINNGLISNLPKDAVVEVPCLVNASGVHGCFIGELPPACAALNMTQVTIQSLVIKAAVTLSRSTVYEAAMLDPRTRSELSLDEIRAMCDELFDAHMRDGMLTVYN